MLQIRLNKGSSLDGGVGSKSLPGEMVTVACPDHLVLADLPVAKGLGSATSATIVKIVGRRSRRPDDSLQSVSTSVFVVISLLQFMAACPCEHVFCLDCARSDSICYLCDERILKIQTIKMMEGIFVCAAPHCLKSFLKKTEFESHIYNSHGDLLQPNMKRENINEPEASSAKPSSTMDTTLRGPPRSSSDPHLNDRRPPSRDQPLQRPLMHLKPPSQWQGNPSEPHPDPWPAGMQHQNPDSQGGMQPEFGQYSDKQQGMLPMYLRQPPNFPMHGNANPMMLGPPPFGFLPLPSDKAPPFYGGPNSYELAQSDSTQEVASDQGSGMGFATGPGGTMNFPEGYSHPWNAGSTHVPFETSPNSQGLLGAPRGMPPPPPPPGPPPPHLVQHKNSYFSGVMSNDGNNYGWQSERRDNFGGNQD